MRALADARSRILYLLENPFAAFDQRAPLLGQADRACRAVQEDNAKMGLEGRKPLGYGGRRKPGFTTSGGQATLLDDLNEQTYHRRQHPRQLRSD